MDLPPRLAASYLRRAFDQVLAVAEVLGDAGLNTRPVGESTNSVGALALHCCAVAEFWLGHVALGRPSARDREMEFTRTATVRECRAAVAVALSQATSDLERIEAGAGTPRGRSCPVAGPTQPSSSTSSRSCTSTSGRWS